MAVLFDTLQMAETLQAGGFTDQQAKTFIATHSSAATVAQVATRGDLMDLGIGIKHDFDVFKTELLGASAAHHTATQGAFAAYKTGINDRLKVLMKDMTIRLGGIVIGCDAVVILLEHFWH